MPVKTLNSIEIQKKGKLSDVDFESIDDQLIKAINNLSKKNKEIWTSPEYNRRDNVHCFFQYPAMMVPPVQNYLINAVTQLRPDIKYMLDPFMGAATTIVTSMRNDLNCFGQDINPLAILLAKVKTGPYYYASFKKKATSVIERALSDNSNKIEKKFPGREKWFKENTSIELSRLVRSIRKDNSLTARRFFWITLAETVRLTSNDRTSTYKLHARNIDDLDDWNPSPLEVFQKLIMNNIEDIKNHCDILKLERVLTNGAYNKKVSISLIDSRIKIKMPRKERKSVRFDLLVSSPPYGDNKTTVPYGQHAYLPLQWIDLADIGRNITSQCLNSTSEIDNRSLGGKLKKIPTKALNRLYIKTPTLQNTINVLKIDHIEKVSKVLNFIYDFDKALDEIIASSKKNAYLVWTIGNRNVGGMEIKNDTILMELMQYRNLKFVKEINREILNKRMAKRNESAATMNTEKILIFRKNG